MAESLTRNLKEAQAKKELEEHDFRNQINSLLRKIEQLENTITEERAAKKVIFSNHKLAFLVVQLLQGLEIYR